LKSTTVEPQRRKGRKERPDVNIEEVGNTIIGAAIKVHSALGPGLLESAYQRCLAYELSKSGLKVDCEVMLPVVYHEVMIDAGYRIDMLIEDNIIVENKTVDKLLPIHEAQLLTYLKMKDCKLGYLFNWNVPIMKEGIRRIVNNL
jgi:GxxExxY protein